MRRFTGILLSIFIITTLLTISVSASETSPEADYLNAIGLLRGTAKGYELEKSMTRLEGAVMIVRLLGDEAQAIKDNDNHPFTDVPSWGDAYVGYMYKHGLTSGKSATLYGANDEMTEVQYVTFLLRSLGYDDREGDFYWADALAKAYEVGLVKVSRQSGVTNFYRRDMAVHTYNCLSISLKNKRQSLEDFLVNKGCLPPTLSKVNKVMIYEQSRYISRPSTIKQLQDNIEKMFYDLEPTKTFDVSALNEIDLDDLIRTAKENVGELPMYSSLMSKYYMNRRGIQLTVNLTFNINKGELELAKAYGRKVVGQIISPEMSDYEKEITIHDYIVEHVTYDLTANPDPAVYTIYGALINQKAVCHGYAESFHYMAYLAGLENEVVRGDAIQNGTLIGHAWNVVQIEGQSYHIDTTWDDPIMSSGKEIISYTYFNLDDEAMEADHIWDQSTAPRCYEDDYNYYEYNRLVVYGIDKLRDFIQEAFDNKEEKITVKVVGEELSSSQLKSIIQSCTGFGRVSFRVDPNNNVVSINNNL